MRTNKFGIVEIPSIIIFLSLVFAGILSADKIKDKLPNILHATKNAIAPQTMSLIEYRCDQPIERDIISSNTVVVALVPTATPGDVK